MTNMNNTQINDVGQRFIELSPAKSYYQTVCLFLGAAVVLLVGAYIIAANGPAIAGLLVIPAVLGLLILGFALVPGMFVFLFSYPVYSGLRNLIVAGKVSPDFILEKKEVVNEYVVIDITAKKVFVGGKEFDLAFLNKINSDENHLYLYFSDSTLTNPVQKVRVANDRARQAQERLFNLLKANNVWN